MGRKAEKEKRERRRFMEFSPSVKNEIVKRSGGMCEECGQLKASEFHHLLSIAIGLMKGINPDEIRSANNCKHVCHSCHQKIDE